MTIHLKYVKFLFFIFSVNEDCPQLIALIYDFSPQSLPQVRHSLHHVMTFAIPCWYQSVSPVIIHRVTAVSISRSSLNLRPAIFCCSPGSLSNPLATKLLDIITISVVSLVKTLQAIQSYFITKPRIIIHSLVFSLRGQVGRNQSPVMWPVWLWHTASWASSWE